MSQSSLQTTPMTRRQWLMSDRPQSRLQARLGRAYMTWQRFSANKLAVAGLCIILLLILYVCFKPAKRKIPINDEGELI